MAQDLFAELHPAVQLLYFAVVVIISILLPHPAVIGCSFLGAIGYGVCLGGFQRVLRFQGLYMLPMTFFVTALNVCFSHYGVTPLCYLKTGPVTLEALLYGGVLAWMLWTSVSWFSAVNQVMTMDRVVYLLGRCSPMFSLSLAITLRFVPRCKRKFQSMREGRKCLGAGEQKKLWHRIKSGGRQLSMLLTWALESGAEMADSMRARCYGTAKRTSYGKYGMEQSDWLCFGVITLLTAVCGAGFALGYARAQYDPVIRVAGPGSSAGSSVTYVCWLLLCLFPVVLRGVQEVRLQRWQRGSGVCGKTREGSRVCLTGNEDNIGHYSDK